jgi:hypothetical protein
MVWRPPDSGSADDVPGYTRPLPEPRPSQPQQPRRISRKRRYLKRAAIAVVAFVVVLALAAGALYALTPSAGEATQLARQQAREHGIA